MVRLTAHLQQLDMESNGKRIDKQATPVTFQTGPIIWGEPGTNGQHSFYQLLHQGTEIAPMEFIGFYENQRGEDINFEGTTCQQKLLANLIAQSLAFAIGQQTENPNKTCLGNRPNRMLLARKLDPYTMGTILAYYEHKVAFQGFIWNINSFDQEGVQLGKKLALSVLQQMKSKGEKTFPLAIPYQNLSE
jgi:glucose-6-phosphate isomerase